MPKLLAIFRAQFLPPLRPQRLRRSPPRRPHPHHYLTLPHHLCHRPHLPHLRCQTQFHRQFRHPHQCRILLLRFRFRFRCRCRPPLHNPPHPRHHLPPPPPPPPTPSPPPPTPHP